MTAGTIHNTTPGYLRIAGELVPSGAAVEVADIEALGDLPAGAWVQPPPGKPRKTTATATTTATGEAEPAATEETPA